MRHIGSSLQRGIQSRFHQSGTVQRCPCQRAHSPRRAQQSAEISTPMRSPMRCQRGVRTYVLSNNNPSSMKLIRRMFAEAGCPMERLFDRVYLSYELRELKPSEAIFRKMIADSGMEPARTLFIDDSERNVTAARALGFQVYMPAPHEDFSHLFDGLLR